MSLFSGTAGKEISDENKQLADYADKIRARSAARDEKMDVSRIQKDIVPTKDGRVITLSPAGLAKQVQQLLDTLKADPNTAWLYPYINKPVIWTYDIDTAATDGNRIFFSPLFAHFIIEGYGGKEKNDYIKPFKDSGKDMNNDERRTATAKKMRYAKFVILHEVYHVLYNHVKREIWKLGAESFKEGTHDQANICQDMEINRDIEGCYPDLRGCTQAITGVWYKNHPLDDGTFFERAIWEDIYDYFDKKGVKLDGASNQTHEGRNPTPKSTDEIYKKGWNTAIDAIKSGIIDPREM